MIITRLIAVTNWRVEGPLIRDILTNRMAEIVMREHGACETRHDPHYFVHYLTNDIVSGVIRMEQMGTIGKITDLAIKERFKNKGHEERMVSLVEKAAMEMGIRQIHFV